MTPPAIVPFPFRDPALDRILQPQPPIVDRAHRERSRSEDFCQGGQIEDRVGWPSPDRQTVRRSGSPGRDATARPSVRQLRSQQRESPLVYGGEEMIGDPANGGGISRVRAAAHDAGVALSRAGTCGVRREGGSVRPARGSPRDDVRIAQAVV